MLDCRCNSYHLDQSVYKKRGNLMTDEERYKKYVAEYCKDCKNKTTDLCCIRISVQNNIVRTKCDYYERED